MVPPGHRDVLILLLCGYWPRFTKLSDKAMEQRIRGTSFLLPTQRRMSEAVALNARLSFVRALEMELRYAGSATQPTMDAYRHEAAKTCRVRVES